MRPAIESVQAETMGALILVERRHSNASTPNLPSLPDVFDLVLAAKFATHHSVERSEAASTPLRDV